jgi:hypothetical protein
MAEKCPRPPLAPGGLFFSQAEKIGEAVKVQPLATDRRKRQLRVSSSV